MSTKTELGKLNDAVGRFHQGEFDCCERLFAEHMVKNNLGPCEEDTAANWKGFAAGWKGCSELYREHLRRLMTHFGKETRCKCGDRVFLVTTPNGRVDMYDEFGLMHSLECETHRALTRDP